MARAARKALADMRALERQAERMNIVDPREVTTEELLGNGATPTMGLSQVRGGANCALDAEQCENANGTFFDGECYNANADACSGQPPAPGKTCNYPEWHGRPAGSNFMWNIGDRVMYDGLAYEATSKNTVQPIRQPPDPLAYTISPYWKEVECDSWAGAGEEECSGSGRMVGGLAQRSGNTMMSGSYRGLGHMVGGAVYTGPKHTQPTMPYYGSIGDAVPDPQAANVLNAMELGMLFGLGAGSPAAMAMADVNSLKGGKKEPTWFDKFVDGLIEKATKKVTELAEKAFNEYFDKLIEYGWNYAKEHGVNWIKENVFGDKVARGVEQRLADEQAEVRRARNREAEEYRRRQHEDENGSSASVPPKNSAADRKASAAAAKDRQAAAKKAYEEARDKKRGGNELEGGYGNYGAYAAYTGGHCPDGEHLRAEVSGKGTEKGMVRKTARRAYEGVEGGKKRRAPAGASDGRRKRADIVKRVMAEKGLKMIAASKYVKEHGLY